MIILQIIVSTIIYLTSLVTLRNIFEIFVVSINENFHAKYILTIIAKQSTKIAE